MAEGIEVGKIYYDLDLDDAQFRTKVAGAKAEAASLGDHMVATGKKISGLGSAFMPLSIAAGVALGFATKAAVEFEDKMQLIHTQAGASEKEVKNLTKAVLDLAPAVGQGPNKLAEGLFFIESAGFRGAKAMDILKLAAEGAAIGGADLADTANALTSVMNTGIHGAENATVAMGNLNAIVGAGKMHFQDLNEAISSGFLATAKIMGVDLAGAGAALATLTRNGVPAAEAATRLRMAMSLMGSPTNEASKALQGIGLTAQEAKATTAAMTDALKQAGVTTNQLSKDLKQPNGIMVAMLDLKKHFKEAGLSSEETAAVMTKAFGGGRMSGTILTLLNSTKDLESTFKQIQDTSGNFSEAWAKKQQEADQKLKNFKATVQVLGIELGNSFLPTLERIAKQLENLAKAFDKLSPGMKTAVMDFLLFAAVLGPVLKIIGNLSTVIGKSITGFEKLVVGIKKVAEAYRGLAIAETIGLGPMLLIVAAIALLALGVYMLIKHWDTVKKYVSQWIKDIARFFTNLWHDITKTVSTIVKDVVNFFAKLPGQIMKFIKKIPEYILDVLEGLAFAFGRALKIYWNLWTKWIPDIVRAVISEIGKLPGQIAHFLSQVWTHFTSWLTRTWHDVVNIVTNMVHDVVNWISGLPGRIAAFASNFYNAAKNTASMIYAAVRDAIGSIPGLVSEMLWKVWHTITNMASVLYNAAKHAASGIWNAFKDGLGIHSPSFVEQAFMAIGAQGEQTLKEMRKHIDELSGLSLKATSIAGKVMHASPSGMLTGTTTNKADNRQEIRETNFYGDIKIEKTADADPLLKKMGLSGKLVGQGLSPL